MANYICDTRDTAPALNVVNVKAEVELKAGDVVAINTLVNDLENREVYAATVPAEGDIRYAIIVNQGFEELDDGTINIFEEPNEENVKKEFGSDLSEKSLSQIINYYKYRKIGYSEFLKWLNDEGSVNGAYFHFEIPYEYNHFEILDDAS